MNKQITMCLVLTLVATLGSAALADTGQEMIYPDWNYDGMVSLGDYHPPWSGPDGYVDGVSDIRDWIVFTEYYGTVVPPPSGSEPPAQYPYSRIEPYTEDNNRFDFVYNSLTGDLHLNCHMGSSGNSYIYGVVIPVASSEIEQVFTADDGFSWQYGYANGAMQFYRGDFPYDLMRFPRNADLHLARLSTGLTQSDFDLVFYGMDFDQVQIVPEPASLSLLAFGGFLLIRRKKRKV